MKCLLIFPLLVTTAVQAAPSEWVHDQTRYMHRIGGRFTNIDYGFSVLAPRGTGGYVTDGGDANHGMIAILGDHRSIVVFPEYTDVEWGNDKPCGSKVLGDQPISTRVLGTTLLGGQPTCDVTLTYGRTVWKVIQAKRDDRGSGIMYTLILRTTYRRLKTDLGTFEQFARSFRRVAITP